MSLAGQGEACRAEFRGTGVCRTLRKSSTRHLEASFFRRPGRNSLRKLGYAGRRETTVSPAQIMKLTVISEKGSPAGLCTGAAVRFAAAPPATSTKARCGNLPGPGPRPGSTRSSAPNQEGGYRPAGLGPGKRDLPGEKALRMETDRHNILRSAVLKGAELGAGHHNTLRCVELPGRPVSTKTQPAPLSSRDGSGANTTTSCNPGMPLPPGITQPSLTLVF